MLPREPDTLDRKDLQYLGGTDDFDLYWRVDTPSDIPDTDSHKLRIFRVSGKGVNTWDVFKIPLEDNNDNDQNPDYGGYWNDVWLSAKDIEHINAYLRCFAPWVLAGG